MRCHTLIPTECLHRPDIISTCWWVSGRPPSVTVAVPITHPERPRILQFRPRGGMKMKGEIGQRPQLETNRVDSDIAQRGSCGMQTLDWTHLLWDLTDGNLPMSTPSVLAKEGECWDRNNGVFSVHFKVRLWPSTRGAADLADFLLDLAHIAQPGWKHMPVSQHQVTM